MITNERSINRRASIVRAAMFSMFLLASGAAVVLARPAKAGRAAGHLDALIALDKKFEGAGTCASPQCHGAAGDAPTKDFKTSLTIWKGPDKHSKAATNLTNKDIIKANPWLTTIAGTLGIKGDLAKSDACINCHGSPVPEKLRGEQFKAEEGVSCYQCHGPSEAWRVPHQKVGWTAEQRAKMDHATLLKTFGLFDTKVPVARAEMCASCHLAIDESLVKAGHPQPVFEQLTFQNKEPEHWIDNNKGLGRLNLYAAGQVVAMRDTLAQLAERPTDAGAFDQAIVHARLVALLVDAKAIPGDAAKLNSIADAAEKGKGDAAALKAVSADADAAANKLLEAIAAQSKALETAGTKAATEAILKSAMKSTLVAISGDEGAALVAHGRRGVEQVYFAIDRLLFASGEAGTAKDVLTPIRDALKPVKALKLYETRNAGDAGAAATTMTAALKDASAKIKTLP